MDGVAGAGGGTKTMWRRMRMKRTVVAGWIMVALMHLSLAAPYLLYSLPIVCNFVDEAVVESPV